MRTKSYISILTAMLLTAAVHADIPAPKDTPPTDWGFVVIGAVSAFLGAVLFVLLGRRFFKRPQ